MPEDTPNYGNARIAKCANLPDTCSLEVTEAGMVVIVIGRRVHMSTARETNLLWDEYQSLTAKKENTL